MSRIDLMKDKWFFHPKNDEQGIAFQEWALSNGLTWTFSSTFIQDTGSHCIGGNYSREGRLGHAARDFYEMNDVVEIFPVFQSSMRVLVVELPEKESPQQIQIRELEETISSAMAQIQKLKAEA